MVWISAAPLFEPEDGLVGMCLQQVHEPNPKIRTADIWVTRAEEDRLFDERDYLLYRPNIELTRAECVNCDHRVPVERKHCFVLWNSLFVPALRSQHLTLGEVRKRALWRDCQCLPAQSLRACDVGSRRVTHLIEHATRARACYQ